ncbi:S8 family serine peptidase [Thermomonospora umbrina]|nr:S8 family serine peptidase [Thermomonospora umbrina]
MKRLLTLRHIARAGSNPYGMTAVLTAVIVVTAVAVVPGTARGGPGTDGGTGSGAQGGMRRVTLVTGDQVIMGVARDGTRSVRIRHAEGREKVRFLTRRTAGGGLLVVPSDALPLLGHGRLDERLFDVDLQTRWRYDDAHRTHISVIAERSANGRAARVAAAHRVTALPVLGVDAMRIDKRDAGAAWTSLTRDAHSGGLGGGVARLWLDGKRRASLDKSVPQIGAPAAWRKGLTGKGTTVAVLDTGYAAAHPDLASVVTKSRGFTNGGPDDVRDTHGHGTHVASTIAGSGKASRGRYRGVAPDARLAVGKVLGDAGFGQDSWIMAGMEWAATTAGAKVVNLSLGGTDGPGVDPMERAVDTLSEQTGALFVIAAGNEGELGDRTVSSPGSADTALTVGAVDGKNALAAFSSRGPRVGDGALKPDITGPGVTITAAKAKTGGPSYVVMSGTSMASPHVAGAAAILAQRHPRWSGQRLKSALMNSAQPSAAGSPFAQGTGRVDIARAVTQEVTADTGSVSAYLRWPDHAPVTHTVTYTNAGTAPVTLKLTATGERLGGGAAPKDMFTVGKPEVTVPAGGTAQVPLRISAERGVATGTYSGLLTATGKDVSLRTAVAAEVEPQSYNLRLRALGRDGAPVPTTVFLGHRTRDRTEVVHLADGKGTVRLPAGDWNAFAAIETPGADAACRPMTLAAVPVRLGAAKEVVLDSRKARRLRTVLDEPSAAQVSTNVGLHYRRGPAEMAVSVIGACPDTSHYVLPTRLRGLTFYNHGTWQRRGWTVDGPSPYRYDLVDWRTGGVPADPVLRVRTADLAKVTTTYRAQNADAHGAVTAGPLVRHRDHGESVSADVTMKVPAQVVHYLTPDERVSWSRGLWLGDRDGATPGHYIDRPPRPVTKGASLDEMGAAAFGPRLFPRTAQRRGDVIAYAPRGLLADAGGVDDGADANMIGKVRLGSGGSALARSDTLGSLSARVPATAATYTLEVSGERTVPYSTLSTAVHAAWTFRSAPGPGTQALPLQVVRLAPIGLDDANRAMGGGVTQIPLTVERNPGSAPATVETLTAKASFDDGRTWHSLPVRRDGRGWTTTVHDPDSGFVSLRTKAVDTQGNTAVQTIARAYAIA